MFKYLDFSKEDEKNQLQVQYNWFFIFGLWALGFGPWPIGLGLQVVGFRISYFGYGYEL